MREKIMKCPCCNGDYDCVHIEAAKINRGGEITTVRREGTSLKAGTADGRGATVEITFWCESGHKWVRKFHFHKGSVFVSDNVLISGCPEYGNYVADLWRD